MASITDDHISRIVAERAHLALSIGLSSSLHSASGFCSAMAIMADDMSPGGLYERLCRLRDALHSAARTIRQYE